MSFIELGTALLQRRAAILRCCLNSFFETYPPETARFMSNERDRFLNPVGYTITQEMEVLLDELLGRMDPRRFNNALDNIIRIRAVQEFPPSSAISFVFLIKNAVRQELGIRVGEEESEDRGRLFSEILEFEHRVDRVASAAFDIYVRCREQIYEIRLKELKGRPRPRRKAR